MSEITSQFSNWEGALGPQSDDEPLFYELNIEGENVRLIGPAPGDKFEYTLDEFDTLVTEGEWVLANDDWENEVYITPDGTEPY